MNVVLLAAPADENERLALLTHLQPGAPGGEVGPRLRVGQPEAEQLRAQIETASVVVVLDSASLLAAPLYPTCIAPALAWRRQHRLPLVPVRLRPTAAPLPGDWRHDLAAVPPAGQPTVVEQAAPGARDAVFVQVAEEVQRHLRALPQTGADLLTLGSQLDRKPQWRALRALCASDDDALVLLPGRAGMGLAPFTERALFALAREPAPTPGDDLQPPRHDTLRVRLWGGELHGVDADEYSDFLREALATRTGARGGAALQLQRAAQARPLYLQLGDDPLNDLRLEPDEQQALLDFLSRLLPRLLAQSRAARKPVRALLAYETNDPALCADIDRAAAAARAAGLRVEALHPLALPTWKEIEGDIAALLLVLGVSERDAPVALARLQQFYERWRAGDRRFEDLPHDLGRWLKSRLP